MSQDNTSVTADAHKCARACFKVHKLTNEQNTFLVKMYRNMKDTSQINATVRRFFGQKPLKCGCIVEGNELDMFRPQFELFKLRLAVKREKKANTELRIEVDKLRHAQSHVHRTSTIHTRPSTKPTQSTSATTLTSASASASTEAQAKKAAAAAAFEQKQAARSAKANELLKNLLASQPIIQKL